jgi:ribonucleoside-diphosphate reductase beta chain
MKVLPRIMQKTESLVVCYPEAHRYQDLQQAGFWTANEVKLEKDIQPLLTELSEADKHGILTVLKLFTLYETRAEEFWGDVIKEMFPRPEIQELAALNAAVELSVHRRVYDKLNQLLNVSSDEYYESYTQSKVMKDRMDFLDGYLKDGTPLEKIGAFAFAEGAVLFSSFAFLMSFRANGNNKLPNIPLAIKFSARDEDVHNQAASWLFQTLKYELEELSEDTSYIEEELRKMGQVVREHEYAIMADVFSKGKIDGITEIQMQHYIDSRINLVLKRLGFKKLYEVKYNPIEEWFDKIIGAYQYVDFFAGQGSSYSRGWDSKSFVWKRGN